MTYLGIDIGLRNFSYCILEHQHDLCVRDWKLVDIIQLCGLPKKSCNKLTLTDIHSIANYSFEIIFPLTFLVNNKIAHISIEQQPHGKFGNQKMIIFSHLLYSYLQKFIQKVNIGDTLQTVEFTAASKKYKKVVLEKYNLQTSTKYQVRKENSVTLCDKILEDLKISVNCELQEQCKRDDLADAFLLALEIHDKWYSTKGLN